MLEIFLIAYFLTVLTNFLGMNYMNHYTKKRLNAETGIKISSSKYDIYEVFTNLIMSLNPFKSIRISYTMLTHREELYRSLCNHYLQRENFEDKHAETKDENQKGPKEFTIDDANEIPIELAEMIMQVLLSTAPTPEIAKLIRKSMTGSLDSLDDFKGIPHIVIHAVPIREDFTNMTIEEKIAYLQTQRQTIIEISGTVVDVAPEELTTVVDQEPKTPEDDEKRHNL